MTASAVIEEIRTIADATNNQRVIQFVNELARKRRLTGEELGALATA